MFKYERLQNQERDVLRQMYNIQIEPTATYSNTKSKSMINLKDQMQELQRKNLRLERERRGKYLFFFINSKNRTIQVIQQKLEELISTNYQPTIMSNYEPYRFLREMKEQHELNEKALNFLRGRLIYHDSTLSTVSDVPTLPYVNNRYTRLRRTDGSNVR